MLNSNNVDTVINIVKEVSSKLSFGYIVNEFLLFDNNELSNMFLFAFKRSVNEIFQDIYKNNLYFNKKKSTLSEELKDDYYSYSTVNIPIFRIYDVRNSSSKLYKVFSYNDLDKATNSYMEEPFNLISKSNFANLTIEYLSSAIYFESLEKASDSFSELKDQSNYCLINRTLLVSKMCSILAQQQGTPNLAFHEQEYLNCLNYIISLGNSGAKPIRLGWR